MGNRHFFFIDDSGSKTWVTPYAKDFVENPPERNDQNIAFWRSNYFVLAGIHVTTADMKHISDEVISLKEKYFGTKNVEIKSEWLRNPMKRKKKYILPFGITDQGLIGFVNDWYGIFEKYKDKLQVQAFVLDKRYFGPKMRVHTPLQLLAEVAFDRLEKHPSKEAVIVFDQMDVEIRSEKNEQGDILKISDKHITISSFYTKYTHVRPRFEKSCNSLFLQMADTVAYNIYRQFVDHGDEWENGKPNLPLYQYFQRIVGNLYSKNGQIAGYGIVKVPNLKKIRWSRREKDKK